jgi:23S rRNA A1618 N6-methylase RlmF
MFVSEIDPLNYRMATNNVEQNGLQDRIHGEQLSRVSTFTEPILLILVIQVDTSALFDGLIDPTKHYDFLMCNPPFYTDVLECQGLTNTRSSARPSANSINTAADVESIYEQGGEVEFVKRMIDESRTYAANVR